MTPEHVGERVTVRYAIREPDGDTVATDAVGYLRSYADDVLVVEKRDGTRARIPAAAVLASRVIPPRPDRR